MHARLSQRHAHGAPDRGIQAPVLARTAETFFGAASASAASPHPDTCQGPSTPASEATGDNDAGNHRSGATIAALLRWCSRLIPAEWGIWRWREVSDETVIASLGSVEIRQTAADWVAQTCVKGDAAQARETALRRLVKYTRGDNLGAVRLDAERPVIQQQLGPRRWRISVRLSNFDHARTAPAPLAPKVEVVARDPEILAVVRLTGRPSYDLVTGGDAIVLDAIANSEWVATGPARIRLCTPGPLPRFTGRFEVAVPVATRRAGVCSPIVDCVPAN
jgi:hypothetical protein